MSSTRTVICKECERPFEWEMGVKGGRPPTYCLDCLPKRATGNPRAQRRPKQGELKTTIVFAPGDAKLLRYVQETLGISQADAMRTSVRAYSALLMNSFSRRHLPPQSEAEESPPEQA